MNETFDDAPVSVSEIRASRSLSAADWSPRDCIVNMLRQIDSGELELDAVCIVYSNTDNESGFQVSSPNLITTIGMLQLSTLRMTRFEPGK